jgi:hypothetical protein
MIPVASQPEPTLPNFNFAAEVRQRGRAWLQSKGIAPGAPPPDVKKLPSYWRSCLKPLWDAYKGTCAYLSVYFPYPTGTANVEHFVAKSENAGDAYEWSNYRLASFGANRLKNHFDDVLDPFFLAPDTFFLELSFTGAIVPNPGLPFALLAAAEKTIERLNLDSTECREMRMEYFSEYLHNRNENKTVAGRYLQKYSPFVHYEAQRQGLL